MAKKQADKKAAGAKKKPGRKMRLNRKGFSDVWAFLFKSLGGTIALFCVFYFIMQDLKASDGKKVSYALLHATQEKILQLEAAGEAINRYIVSRQGKLDKNAAVFVWDMSTKTEVADAVIWFNSDDRHWRLMDRRSEHNFMRSASDSRTIEIEKLLHEKSNYAQSKAVVEPQQIQALLSSTKLKRPGAQISHLPWMFSLKKDNGKRDFLLLIPSVDKLFSFQNTDQSISLYKFTLFSPFEHRPIIQQESDTPHSSLFKPITLEHSLMINGVSWDTEIVVAPTTAHMLFTILPWSVLVIGVLLTILGCFYLHRNYTREGQIKHISETLEQKNAELQEKEAERQAMMNKFRKSEWESRAVINAVSDIIFETDSSGAILFLNETWRKVTGREVTGMIGENLFEQLHPDEAGRHKEMFQEFTAGYREGYRSEARLKMQDNRYRFIELGFSVMRLSDDTARIVGTMSDIEKRKKAEIAHFSAEKQFKEMFENALNGIYQSTPDGRVTSLNKAFSNILGYDSTEDFQETVADFGGQVYVDPHQRSVLEMQVTSQGHVLGIENEVYQKDGTKIWILESLRAIYDDEGQVLYYEGNIWDITERRQADQALRSAKLEAELTSRARIEFMANMSHELRTPLNAVIGFSEIIQNEVMGPIGEEVYVEYARDINNSGTQLLTIINDILELSQIEIGDRELKEKSFPLMRVVQSVLSLLDHKIKEGLLQVAVNIPKEMPNIFAEELAFKQIIMNLLSNCIKYTKENGKIDVNASVDSEGNMVLDIIDTGIGMTDKEIERALQPFGQAASELDRDDSGAGLGLSIVQSLVELHRGRFLMTSQKGVGTTVKMVFPKDRVMPVPKQDDAPEDDTVFDTEGQDVDDTSGSDDNTQFDRL